MEQETVAAIDLAGSVVQDLSVWGLFMEADIVVKIVMVALVFASFWTWAIIFDKVMRLRRMRRLADGFEDDFWSGGSLEDLYDRIDKRPMDPMASIFSAAMREWRRAAGVGERNPGS